ncbi:hypothetical protein DM02DRAFT_734714 [Periconia macrospinosa]|uniref:Uncharacterized protein n=1 Tax=Periconia macrospinosa TaxID=97972 RepID=A0A2V1CXA5_9PLEO|nr:hypothetical protein DM02DRAFT_734714 [Periconia macrospinosa]
MIIDRNHELQVTLPDWSDQSPAYTFYIADYIKRHFGDEIEYGVLVHGTGQYSHCQEMSKSLDGFWANLKNPSAAPDGRDPKYRDSLPKLDWFALEGVRDRRICGLRQGLRLSRVDDVDYGQYSFCDLVPENAPGSGMCGFGDNTNEYKSSVEASVVV